MLLIAKNISLHYETNAANESHFLDTTFFKESVNLQNIIW